MEVINALGRRKKAVARVYLRPGNGNIKINKRSLEEYFPLPTLQYVARQALELTNNVGKYDIDALIDGGGFKGQVEAFRLGVARAIIQLEPEHRPVLKTNGLLRRDPRMVERKKPGQKKARKKFQFSKR
ncbi:MAG: 30S ribosomal protein S9 [Bacteroidales bacterium]|jgi:small subunit ribosomal protein S9|nr:30S ribosomal protein S9 [Bacteroidales bacterium]NCU34909.1 30S ribosomal protein S9 [Candidatus Falkowbacteria bacterium]MDD2632271.1 30S ribosomal protein S9 [Bacteroidales bacterium]MDD3130816.1 30S ribosomal protein S9 [Bacteroidales bacterium]MDD3525947.1 30S ribosomal protein S9 [Bacteroidales bacterium]